MRRLATALPTVVATVAAVLTLSTGTALAHGSEAEHHVARHEAAHHHKVKPLVTLTGVITDTPTATIAAPGSGTSTSATPGSDTATSTITIAVKGGERSLHRMTVVLTMDSRTVVRRGDERATVADLRKGDHVSVRARRMPDGTLLALRVNAAVPDGREHGREHGRQDGRED